MEVTLMQSFLKTDFLGRNCFVLNSVNSTNTYIKERWRLLDHGHTVIAKEQLSGRGRKGKSFYSPKGDGLYFSVLLKESRFTDDPLFTVKLSYAVCRAIDILTSTESVSIKWVNDIYSGAKKISGMLCEAVKSPDQTGIIAGIGVNFVVDKALVPPELRKKIGALTDVSKKKLSKEQLCALILNELESMYGEYKMTDAEFISLYRRRSAVLGKEISVIKDNFQLRAAALDIASDGGLIVRYESGITEKLTAGEISILFS